ncbi:MAG: hypothetical protein N4J56_007010 [Chroococcidiopsis sp. SAG 2025]|uniref:hypothetical protein n=1 Tax=Chroococcidiopsis sp. SAG 2025 TaxID=171389 RepID=UPI0029372334|nr:hypothetical protein [Chroococcidiopsis sp. SAG 2025]MDV2997305.1 hypothetical protein [Chroococcidiopsis sp. SAG 2025]
MSHSSQVSFQAAIYLQVVFQAIIYLAANYTNNALENANTALLEARQATLLLEMVMTECSLDRVERQNLLKLEVAYTDLDFFIEKLLIALDALSPQSSDNENF